MAALAGLPEGEIRAGSPSPALSTTFGCHARLQSVIEGVLLEDGAAGTGASGGVGGSSTDSATTGGQTSASGGSTAA